MDKDALDRIADLVTSADVAMLTTEGADGLHARPLAVLQKRFDGTIRFLIEDPSPKVEEIRANPRVNVSLSSKAGYLSLAGNARLIEDNAAAIDELWGPSAEAWFPGGREDPEIVVLEVLPESAEYWAKTETGLVAAAKATKAFFTKEQPDIGENRVVEF
ncbi:pyridoxamine 5'-phosphate oxidase family protein [Agromyces aerolatus]|uniref:pyridoxamine 5'-phosphate oxidase family protein n=1 Tax=Agromyces sp. LY-1074 TaxID=3074080 RepID=UPI00285DCC81|nr:MULTISPECIES: pyridoxamine 5'-phosphate oxidase family protein [unclassified Agromyces]MDR5698228.1 pyridoxamine 5'-phosphate oxidase family protein [Agromyces sp. LY-1074]MDR5704522.1 pyridoxamine 5'-phosphate oxidase family protein [Agromyces sp. LY-1358]